MTTDQIASQPGEPLPSTGGAATAQPANHLFTFTHVPHPHIALRRSHGPVKVADQLDRSSAIARFNSKFALLITLAVGSMWCAYLFGILAFVSFPSALSSGNTLVLVGWIAQTFLQLILLPVIIVGQNIQAQASDKRAEETYLDAEAVLHEAEQIQQHLATQDAHLAAQDQRLQALIASVTELCARAGTPPPTVPEPPQGK